MKGPAPSPSTFRTALLFNLSGFLGTLLFYGMYQLLFTVLPLETRKATVSWTLSYICSIVWQHALHRWMVFGSKSSYWTSLGMTYLCYSVSIVLSSLFTDILVQQLHIHHQVAWILTLVATGLLNFFTLRKVF